MVNRSSDHKLEPELEAMFSRHGILDGVQSIVPHSLLSAGRLKAIIRAVELTQDVLGDAAEIGCNAGGTSRVIALSSRRRHWACDTFAGLVDAGDFDTNPKIVNGAFSNLNTTFDVVSERLSDIENVRVVRGYFPECATEEMKSTRYALVHIDVDTYQSIHGCFGFFVTRMQPGAIMLIDDAIGRGTDGAKLAWAEIAKSGSGHWKIIEENDPQIVLRFS